jgi:hypothetical protein
MVQSCSISVKGKTLEERDAYIVDVLGLFPVPRTREGAMDVLYLGLNIFELTSEPGLFRNSLRRGRIFCM